MTRDTDYPKERVEEREHGVFVPPDEQHVSEDGAPTEPMTSTEWTEKNFDQNDQNDDDRVEQADRVEPATPLDTGTAEDAERAEEMEAADETRTAERVDDLGAEDEAHARSMADDNDAVDVDAVDVDTRNMADDNVDSRNMDAVDTNADRIDGIEADRVDGVDPDTVAVGTASVPERASAPATEFWPSGLIEDLRGRWDAVQMRFVDDPSGVANDARALVGEAVSAVREAIDRLEARLDEAVSDTAEETEQLRQKVAHYRDVFESLLSR